MHADVAVFVFLSIGAIALFGVFLPFVTWISSRQKERDAYYKSETIRRIAEASGDGAKAAIEMLREEDRLKRIKSREGLKIGGVINIGVGIGLTVMLWTLGRNESVSPYMVGLIPFLIGVAMLVYVYVLAAPIEDVPKN
jgi:Flp pilus assembly protein TadB